MIFNPIYGSGGSSPSPALGSKTITANGTYLASQDNLDGYDEVTANVPNTYAAGDEGKVVSSGALVAQSSATYTQNNTYDTTLINSVTVNVSGSSPNLQAKTGISITSNGSFSYTPDAGYDGLSEVSGTVNVSGGGSLSWEQVTPTDLGAGSFISSGSALQVGSSAYPGYHCVVIDLSTLPNKIVYIDNTSNNRNYWGTYTALSNGQSIKYPSSRQAASSGKLVFYSNDLYLNARYFVYDYTSAGGNAPLMYTASVTTPT